MNTRQPSSAIVALVLGAVALTAVVTTLGAGRAAAAAQPPSGLEHALALLELLDTTIVTLDVEDEPLRNALRELNEQSPVPLQPDWDALDRLAVGPRDEITLALRNTSLSTVLAGICLQLGDEFDRPVVEVFAGQAILTTFESSSAMGLTDVYDVRDLLIVDDAVRRRLRGAPSPVDVEGESDGQPEPGVGLDERPADVKPADTDAPPVGADDPLAEIISEPVPFRAATPGEELMFMITEHVDPDGWNVNGGSRAAIGEHDGVLLVTAPATIHRRLRDALRNLRRAHVRTVSVQATIVDLPRLAYERLARRYGASSAALGRAVVAASGGEDATIVWQTTAATALDRQLTVSSRGEAVTIGLMLSPRLDPKTGILSLSVEVDAVVGEDRRRVETTVALPLRNGAAVLELPAATAGERMRLLVVIPERS